MHTKDEHYTFGVEPDPINCEFCGSSRLTSVMEKDLFDEDFKKIKNAVAQYERGLLTVHEFLSMIGNALDAYPF